MESTYTYPELQTWLSVYLKKRNNKRFQDLEGLPWSMKAIAKEQGRIRWINCAEGRMTKRIQDMQTSFVCNRGLTYTEDHWMRDFIRKLIALTHEQWLGCNLMKHHRTEGSIVPKAKEELARELDKLLDTDIHNIIDNNRWMLMDPSDRAVMSMRETKYAIFELEAA